MKPSLATVRAGGAAISNAPSCSTRQGIVEQGTEPQRAQRAQRENTNREAIDEGDEALALRVMSAAIEIHRHLGWDRVSRIDLPESIC